MKPRNDNAVLRTLPSIGGLLETPEALSLTKQFSRPVVVDAIRGCVSEARGSVANGGSGIDLDSLMARVRARLQAQDLCRLRRVVNATGILIHTNLGRSPLAQAAMDAVRASALHYSNLELDLATGKRGGRGADATGLLTQLTGAEAALVVNNCAAAVLVALTALASDGELIVSRGEQVEIGGAFRMPDVIRLSGAGLVEVGTTNKTRVDDYRRAITDRTRMLLKVHRSNFRMAGFVAEASLTDLAKLARQRDLVLVQDLGSGALVDLRAYGLPHEPTVPEAIAAGVDIVAFSGDKLLGGPQAGILVGKASLIARIAAHPLYRALRADKMTLAALAATLRLYLRPENLAETLPLLAILAQSQETLTGRADSLASGLRAVAGVAAVVEAGSSRTGGGTLPEVDIPTVTVRVEHAQLSASELADRLRLTDPPILGVVGQSHLILDCRTISDEEVSMVVRAFGEVTVIAEVREL